MFVILETIQIKIVFSKNNLGGTKTLRSPPLTTPTLSTLSSLRRDVSGLSMSQIVLCQPLESTNVLQGNTNLLG